MASIEADATEVRRFAADLDAAGKVSEREVRAVVTKGALNITKQLADEASQSVHFGQVARSINFDVRSSTGGIEAEIGPDKQRSPSGRLGNIAYFGTSRGGGTLPDPEGALLAEAPAFEQYLLDLAEESL